MSTAPTPAADTATASTNYDVVVIGGGPGGYVAAIRAAQLGLKAAVVEREELGGICLNWGCIPSKTLLRNAEVLSLINRADSFGITVGNVSADYGAGMARCKKVITTQVRGVNFLMRKNQIDVVRGNATVTARDRVRVTGGADGDRELRTKNVIIATGSRVRQLKGVEVDGRNVISAREMWAVDDLPKSILIIGSGAIGVEFATVFQAYGTEVTLVEFLPRVLPLEDEEISTELARSFSRRGIKIMTSTSVDGVEVTGDAVKVRLSPAPGGQKIEVNQWQEQAQQERTTEQGQTAPQTVEVDRVLLAAGFQPNSGDLGLEALGVTINPRGFIDIDEHMQTNVPGIYAIGDVTGKVPLAHVASAQGEVAAEAIAGHVEIKLDYNAMPRCTYSNPQVASMGLTEVQAREGGREVRVGKFPFRPNGKAQALNELDGQIKIIADATSGEILGVQMIGPDVTELIGEFSLARSLESTPFELARSVHPHPTLSEVVAEAALNVEGHAIHM
jgi:dihydrolipoamide dehydrogenase